MSEPRAAALWVIENALRHRRPTDALMHRFARRLDRRDRALLHQLVNATLRWLLRIDSGLCELSGRSLGKIEPRLLGPLRLGAVQLLLFDRIPAHAAVDSSVELAKSRSRAGAGFVNAVLRKVVEVGEIDRLPIPPADPLQRLAIETSHPRFFVQRWWSAYGEDATRRLLAANNRSRPPAMLCVGGERRRRQLIGELVAEGIVARPSALSPVGLLIDSGRVLQSTAYSRGELYPQDEASQCAALIPLPRPTERVLDAAAAPGGKTLSLLAGEPALRVVSADRHLSRLGLLLENRRRTESRFRALSMDGRQPAMVAGFDRVLVDLPCSGTGTLRKHPELKWRIGTGEIDRLVAEARDVLNGLAPLVGRGGLLVVATCSIEPEENEEQVAAFLSRHKGFRPFDLDGRVHESMLQGIEARGRWRLLPADDHDGFTVHVLQRRGPAVA